jgi:hypothetical protein
LYLDVSAVRGFLRLFQTALLDFEIWSAQKFNTSRSFPLWPLAGEELNQLASNLDCLRGGADGYFRVFLRTVARKVEEPYL